METGDFRRIDTKRVAPGAVVLVAWSTVYLSLMVRIAPFELGFRDFLNIGLRSLVGPAVLTLVLSAISHRWLKIVVGAGVSFGFFAVVAIVGLYHAWSGSLPHAALIVHVGEVREIIPQVLLQVANSWLVAVAVMWLIQMAAIVALPARQLRSSRAVTCLIGVVLSVAVIHGLAVRVLWDAGDRVEANRLWVFDLNESATRFGLAQMCWRDVSLAIARLRHPIDQDWPGTLTGRPAVPEPVLPRVQNVILLQVESLDPWVIEYDVDGRPVMPHLRELVRKSRSFVNFFAQHSGGGSSDAELSAHIGVLPLATHSGLLTADWQAVRPLPAVVVEQGWSSAAFHANRASYFNRNVVYPRLGFERFFSQPDFSGNASGWESIDAEFMHQSLAYVESMKEPFFASLITLQSHGPFTHHQPNPAADPGPKVAQLERDYLQCMHEVDDTIGVLATWMEAGNRWKDTALLVFGDHRSKSRGPEPPGPERIPLIVVADSIGRGVDLRVGTHLDLGPTVLDLLGLPAPDGWLGTSLLDQGPGAAVFNTLREIRLRDGVVKEESAPERMPFLLYSATVLGQ